MATDVSTLLHRLGGVYRDPTRISRDSTKLLRSPVGANLVPSISPLIQNTGEETPPVLVFSGTVSMTYKGGTYNIPVDVYLPPPYPVRPPVCFVRPTAGMMVKENHRHVAPDGMVYMPYLHEWRPHSHNLVEMVVMMSSLFGASPPVFAKPAGHRQAASTGSASMASSAASAGSSSSTAAAAASHHHRPPSYDDIAVRRSSTQDQTAAALAESRREEEERRRRAEAADRRAQEELQRAIDASKDEVERKRREAELERRETEETRRLLTSRLQRGMQDLYHGTRAEIQEDLRDQAKLQRGGTNLETAVDVLRARKAELEEGSEKMDGATVRIKEFLSGLEAKGAEEVRPDEMVSPADVHSTQMLHLSAENAAISDALYFLDRALVRGRVDMSGHMKAVRRLAKRQFLIRAHLLKIAQVRASQMKGAC